MKNSVKESGGAEKPVDLSSRSDKWPLPEEEESELEQSRGRRIVFVNTQSTDFD